jgi:hypothetical protein
MLSLSQIGDMETWTARRPMGPSLEPDRTKGNVRHRKPAKSSPCLAGFLLQRLRMARARAHNPMQTGSSPVAATNFVSVAQRQSAGLQTREI